MIDTVFKVLQTLVNKENQGYLSPTEFNLVAHNVQSEIFREYFEDENRDKNKENRGLTNKGYANLDFNQRQRIQQFAEIEILNKAGIFFALPPNLYFIEDDGITTPNGKVIEEVERSQANYLKNSEAAATELYPVYERYSNNIRVFPETLNQVEVRYLRTPAMPKWTYTVVGNTELYDPTNPSFQDFELHESEFSNIVLRMLSHFGINLREAEVVQIAETLKDKMNFKENN